MSLLGRLLSSRRRYVANLRNFLIFLVAIFILNNTRPWSRSKPEPDHSTSAARDTFSENGGLRCRDLPGANDTVVVLKTGVTEFEHKLPVHIDTTLRCYPNYLIFSDHAETFRGVEIIDSLEPVSPKMKYEHSDFEFYLRVQESGRAALKQNELSNKAGFNRHPNDVDKMGMGGWRLDKWKFLPMYNHTYHLYPGKKWYVFIEADTYMFWSNMLKYQASMDHTKPIYAGADLFIDWTLFAHGGAGILVSQAAMKLFVDEYLVHSEDWEFFTERHWAGDIVLGRAFNAAGVHLLPAWPHFHPHAPGNDTYYWADDDRRFWCYPAISYHHVTPEVVGDLWRFEQEWIESEYRSGSQSGGKEASLAVDSGQLALKRREIFINYIHGKMRHTQHQWDNNCLDDYGILPSMDACRALCETVERCLQWRFDSTTSRCHLNGEARWGDAAPNTGYISGWMYERVEAWIAEQVPCGKESWVTE